MQVYQVGSMYGSRTSWPELAQYNYRRGKHELTLFLNNPTEKEIHDVAKGEAAFALFVSGGVIVLNYCFGDAIPWSDAPYTIHLLPVEDRILPPLQADTALMHIVLVDASSGVIKALRILVMPSDFTLQLHMSIREQSSLSFDLPAYDRELGLLYANYSPSDIAGKSMVRFQSNGL